ncbi:hypothetical protein NECAME_16517 [Necator americanus]|uniref:Uncharacterized protein n=1 Tax=Necator americanus TaxID=51031 RepID=W2TVC1_NECAM|nr:hypothetical protein NECAME_16517 [Necator americanus]ETN86045.1 hypothetical protein NECAME_16517 [Necator americanus]
MDFFLALCNIRTLRREGSFAARTEIEHIADRTIQTWSYALECHHHAPICQVRHQRRSDYEAGMQ